MTVSSGKTSLKSVISALSGKEKVLILIGFLLLLVGLYTGRVIIIIALLLVAVGLWGYVYISVVMRMTPAGIHRKAVHRTDERMLKQEDDRGIADQIPETLESEDEASALPDEPKPDQKQPGLTETHITEFFGLDSEVFPSSSEPRSEFEFLLGKVLGALKESLIAHTAAFFWVNFEKDELVFQGRASDSHNVITERKIRLGSDVVSQIARKEKPEFISHISPNSERDLLPYYSDIDFVKSFIGVPVMYQGPDSRKSVVGVLAIDSKAEDAFGSETLTLLSQFTKLLAALIKSHTEKYDLLVDSNLLLSIRTMHESMRENLELRSIIQALVVQIKRLIGYDYLAVTMFNDDKRSWVIYHVDVAHGGSYISPHQIIAPENSLVATVLDSNKHLLVDDLSTVTIPRFNGEEKIDSRGSILIVPMSSFKKCYGTISIENRERSAYSARDIDVLYRLVENAASALEILYTSELVEKYVIIDDATGLLKKNHFEQRLRDEIHRADDFGYDLTYIIFSLDNMQQLNDRFGKEGCDTAVYAFTKFISHSVRPYDIIGRLDYNRFGVLLLNTVANDGYLWAEKIRKNFAGQVLTMNDKTTSVTVSSGVCGLTETMQFAELSQHAVSALQKAVESGGNIVRVY